MRYVADIETDGLLPELTRLHCLSVRDVAEGSVLTCSDQPGYTPIEHGLTVLADADASYWHNGLSFDIPAIQKVYPRWRPKGLVRDTLVMAQAAYAHIRDGDFERAKRGSLPKRLIGSHKLEAWGYRLGVHKGEYTEWCKEHGLDPWSAWRPEMSTYCDGDTATTRALLLRIEATSGLTAEAIETEHELAEYLLQQERNGWPFDVAKAQALAAKLAARREELSHALIEKFGTWKAPDGKPFVPKRDNAKLGYTAGVPVQKFKQVQFNPSSRAHIERCLREHYGWRPSKLTKTGQAEITDDTLAALSEIPEAALITEFLLVQKRLGLLSEGNAGWMRHAKPHPVTGAYHIHHRVKQNNAITHRASHVSPNLAQVPKVGSPFGAESRELFTVPPGWVQVGADVSGLELRNLAHYMSRWDGGSYAQVVLAGDIHTVNMQAAGLATRNDAKTFIYAYIYGEGDEARGAKFLPKTATAEQRRKKGKAVAKKFTDSLPALGSLQDAVRSKLKQRGGPGYILMPDGRRTYIAHEHSALNYLLQGSGAIICKRWIVEFSRRLTAHFGPQGWSGQWAALGWIHDEVQLAVRPEIVDEVKAILIDSIRHITTHYRWRVPLDGEAKEGANWRETH